MLRLGCLAGNKLLQAAKMNGTKVRVALLIRYKKWQCLHKDFIKNQIRIFVQLLTSTLSESLHIATGTKEDKYETLLPQLRALVQGEKDLTANLANIAAALKQTFGFFWVGFYLVKDNELVLGPFQGPLACTRIAFGKGVCGSAWKSAATILVEDVEKFPGHIACSSASKSEIVVPFFSKDGKVAGVLDIDEDRYAMFGPTDKLYLEKVAELLTTLL